MTPERFGAWAARLLGAGGVLLVFVLLVTTHEFNIAAATFAGTLLSTGEALASLREFRDTRARMPMRDEAP